MPTLADLREEIMGHLPSETHRSLFSLVELEGRKDGILLVRIPQGIDVLDGMWETISGVLEKHHLKFRRADKWPTIEDLDGLLGKVKWVWKRWIPYGFLTLLVGEPGGGKSMLALDFTRIITRADTWPLEDTHAEPGCAVWVETEAGQQLLMERSKTLGLTRNQVFIPSFEGDMLSQPDLMDPKHQERITTLVKVKHPALVVVDSLGGAHTRGENKIEEVRPLLAYLAQLARDEDCGVIMVHHLRKRSVNEDLVVTLDRVRGSSGITAFARSVISLERIKDGGSIMRVIKTNLCKPPPAIVAHFNYDALENVRGVDYEAWEPPAPKQTKKAKATEFIWAYLLQNGKVPLKQILEVAATEGYTRTMVYSVREGLADSIIVTGTGHDTAWEISNPTNPLADDEE